MTKIRLTIVDTLSDRKMTCELPDNVIVQRLFEVLVKQLNFPTADETGKPFIFSLTRATNSKTIALHKTLAEAQIQQNDVLNIIVTPTEPLNFLDTEDFTFPPLSPTSKLSDVLQKNTMPRIFISYRRADSAGYAGRIFDRLSSRFNSNHVFMDIDTITPGTDFVDAIERAVASCVVLLAIMGREWLSATDASGKRRLDDPNDFVRIEVATALARNITVIPVLVNKAAIPKIVDLPTPMSKLSRLNAIEISDERFHFDVDRLIDALEEYLQSSKTVNLSAQDEPSKNVDSTQDDQIVGTPVKVVASNAEKISVDILITNQTARVKVELPAYALVRQLLPQLTKKLGLPTTMSNGWPVLYEIYNQSQNIALENNLTIQDNGVKDGDTLVFVVHMTAG